MSSTSDKEASDAYGMPTECSLATSLHVTVVIGVGCDPPSSKSSLLSLSRRNLHRRPSPVSARCGPRTRPSNFGQMGLCCRQDIEDVVAVCVGLSRHLPDFPKCNMHGVMIITLVALSSRPLLLIVQAGCCVASHHAAVLSSHHAALSSSCRPLTVTPSCRLITPTGCCVAPRRAVVLSSRHPLTPNITPGARDDGG